MLPVIWCELKIKAQVQVQAWTLIWTFFKAHAKIWSDLRTQDQLWSAIQLCSAGTLFHSFQWFFVWWALWETPFTDLNLASYAISGTPETQVHHLVLIGLVQGYCQLWKGKSILCKLCWWGDSLEQGEGEYGCRSSGAQTQGRREYVKL